MSPALLHCSILTVNVDGLSTSIERGRHKHKNVSLEALTSIIFRSVMGICCMSLTSQQFVDYTFWPSWKTKTKNNTTTWSQFHRSVFSLYLCCLFLLSESYSYFSFLMASSQFQQLDGVIDWKRHHDSVTQSQNFRRFGVGIFLIIQVLLSLRIRPRDLFLDDWRSSDPKWKSIEWLL